MTTAQKLVDEIEEAGANAYATCFEQADLVSYFKTVQGGEVCEVFVYEDGSSVNLYKYRIEAMKP